MYSKKEILIATVIALVILILCIGSIITAIMVASTPATPTPPDPVPLPAKTEDILNTYAATMNSGNASASQFNADVQYVLDTSAIPCLLVLLVVLGLVVGFEIRNRRKERKN